MHEKDQIKKSLERHVFKNNPMNDEKKEKWLHQIKYQRTKNNRHLWSVFALMGAAAVFIFFISQSGSFHSGQANHAGPSRGGSGSTSSASWAYAFVKYKGVAYVITQQTVKKSGHKIGEVTQSSDRETSDESGNFSNEFPKGTKYFQIPGVSTAKAIAVQKPDGTVVKAINNKIWMSRPEAMNELLTRFGHYREFQVQSIQPSEWLGLFPKAEKVSLVQTNLGKMNVVVFPQHSNKVQVQTVSEQSGDYIYKINGRSISTKQPLFFYLSNHLIAATTSKEIKDIFQMETRIQKQAIFEKIDWTLNVQFDYKQQRLIGEKGKLGITNHSKIYAGKPNKFLWYFFNGEKPDTPFKVIGIRKSDGMKSKVFLTRRKQMVWGFHSVQNGYPTEMVLPEPGVWSLTSFVGDKFHGSIVVNVLPNKTMNRTDINKVVIDKVRKNINDLKKVRIITKSHAKALKLISTMVHSSGRIRAVIDTVGKYAKPSHIIEIQYDDHTRKKYKIALANKGDKSILIDPNGFHKNYWIPASQTNELRKLLGK